MPVKTVVQGSKALRLGILVAGVAGLAVAFMGWRQVESEKRIDREDLTRRSSVLIHRLTPAVLGAVERPGAGAAEALGYRLEGHSRLVGFAVFYEDGRLMAAGSAVGELLDVLQAPVARVAGGQEEAESLTKAVGGDVHILARAIRDPGGARVGIVAAIHEADYLAERATRRLLEVGLWGLLLTLLILAIVVGVTWFAYERPLKMLADWMKRLRTESAAEHTLPSIPNQALAEESEHLAASFRAARSARLENSQEAVRLEKVWSRERLAAHSIDCLKGDQLIVVSNREPYMHVMRDGERRLIMPAGGLVTALDPVLRACGGLWVAHGAGDADREAADSGSRVAVPPGDPRYTLRRVWMSREEEQGYYYGFSNEGLWPLCHLTHERPVFRAEDWEKYVAVNRRFTDAVLEEIGSGEAMVWVQDYHLALVPELLKKARPDLKVGLFWHIPWPQVEAFRICPWRVEVLHGMLGADLVGFHLQQHCNNFLDAVDRMVEARLDWDHFAADLKGHKTLVRPFPISVQGWNERGVPAGEALQRQIEGFREQYQLEGVTLAVGVDRIDYTKGLVERLRAVARFLEKHPEQRGRFTFVELGAPSRTHIRRYRELNAELESLADDINWRYQTDRWKPVRFLASHHDGSTVHAFLSMADVCIVSSLHDGMNLVAKEFVAAKENGDGVLVLSEFAGASRELPEAIMINPYDIDEFADAINTAVTLEPAERRRRMGRMRKTVEENNVYRWAASFLVELSQGRPAPSGPAAGARAP